MTKSKETVHQMADILQVIATIITTVAGTVAVHACAF